MRRLGQLLTWSSVALAAMLPGTSSSESKIITMELLQLRDVHTAIQLYKRDFKELPSDPDQLYERGQLLVHPIDHWGHPYVYSRIEGIPGYVLYSKGKDGVDQKGGGDDIVGTDKQYTCEDYRVNCFWSAPLVSGIAVLILLAALAWAISSTWRRLQRGRRHRDAI
jgi:type II secretory pathway pseudopilin PulG